jgi:quinol monooxygenase YgiN
MIKQGPYRTDLLNNIVEVTVKPEDVEKFKAFMVEYLPETAAFRGCEFVYLMQALSDSQKFFFFETWESQERLSAYHAWRGQNKAIADMFAAPPRVHQGRGIFSPPSEQLDDTGK